MIFDMQPHVHVFAGGYGDTEIKFNVWCFVPCGDGAERTAKDMMKAQMAGLVNDMLMEIRAKKLFMEQRNQIGKALDHESLDVLSRLTSPWIDQDGNEIDV